MVDAVPARCTAALICLSMLVGCPAEDDTPPAGSTEGAPAPAGDTPTTQRVTIEHDVEGRPDRDPVDRSFSAALHVQRSSIDLGSILALGEYTGAYEIANRGSSPFSILSVTTSSRALEAQASATELQPGDEAEIRFVYRPETMRPSIRAYRINVVTSINPDTAVILDLAAELRPAVTSVPPNLIFGIFSRHEGARREFSVHSIDPDVRFVSAESPNEHIVVRPADDFDVREPHPAYPGMPGQIVFECIVAPGHPWSYVNTFVPIELLVTAPDADEPTPFRLNMPLIANIYGEVHAVPAVVHFGGIDRGADFEQTFQLSTVSGIPFNVLEIRVDESTMPGVEAIVLPEGDTDLPTYDVVVRGNAGDFTGDVRGVITIVTDVANEGDITIRFDGGVAP